jgi:ActD protein
MRRVLLLEFESPEELAAALRDLYGRGHRDLDAYTPYSTDIVREALALEPSRLPRWVLAGGLLGATLAYLLEWWTTGISYPLNVGGRPLHMPLAFVPISFEMGVLGASFTAFFGVLLLGKLVRLWDPVFEVEGFGSMSVNRFWLRMDESPEGFDPESVVRELAPLQPLRTVLLEAEA